MGDLGSLSQCMLDGNTVALTQARHLRTKALAVSVFLEMAVGMALLLWPLLGPTEVLRAFNLTPVPPYHGMPDATRVTTITEPASGSPKHVIPLILRQPTQIPLHMDRSSEGAPNIGTTDPQLPNGFDIFGATGDRPMSIVPRPVTPLRAETPLRRSTEIMNALLIRKVQPEYPAIALNIHLSGEVQLRAVIGTDGSVQQLQVLSGNPILAAAAMAAVEQWKYQPTQLDGRPVEVETIITVNFVLQQ